MMKTFFQKNWKWLIGIGLTMITIAIPAWELLSNSHTKSIDVCVDSITPIVETKADKVGKIAISLDGVEIDMPYLSVIEISNSGDLPIVKSDFEKPIFISTGQKSRIIKATVTQTLPKGISAKLTWEENKLQLHPALLNPEDKIIISVLSSINIPTFEVTARISGIKHVIINKKEEQNKNNLKGIGFLLIALVYLVACYVVFNPLKSKVALNKKSMWFIATLLILVYAVIIENFFKEVEIAELWVKIVLMFGVVVIAIPVSELINKTAQQKN